jgi:hypothetical protein
MGTPIAIIVGAVLIAVLIAAALLVTNHWQLQVANNTATALRLNRWTGEVEVCALDAKSLRPETGSLAGALGGARLECEHQ